MTDGKEKTNPKEISPSSRSDDEDSSCSSSDSDQPTNFNKKPKLLTDDGVKKRGIKFEALSRHGYSGGPSVLNVPPPRTKGDVEHEWSWSSGKDVKNKRDSEETFEEREKTRMAVHESIPLSAAEAIAEQKLIKSQRIERANEQKGLSFSQKEKRKRELGQASRGKSYVEEEKRLLRDQGVYSSFD